MEHVMDDGARNNPIKLFTNDSRSRLFSSTETLILTAERGGCELSGDNGTLSSRRRRREWTRPRIEVRSRPPRSKAPPLPLFFLFLFFFRQHSCESESEKENSPKEKEKKRNFSRSTRQIVSDRNCLLIRRNFNFILNESVVVRWNSIDQDY